MPPMNFFLRLFSLLALLAYGPAHANLSLDHLKHIEQIVERSSDRAQTSDQLLEKLNDHRALFHYNRNLAAFLVHELQNDRQLSGTHLNLIHKALSAFIKVSQALKLEANELRPTPLDFRRRYEASLQWTVVTSMLSERFKTIHSLYFHHSGLRRIVKDKTRFDLYGLSDLNPLTDALLNPTQRNDVYSALQAAQTIDLNRGPFEHELKQSALFHAVSEGDSLESIFRQETFWSDRLNAFTGSLARGISAGFGALVGNIEWRTGHLHQMPAFTREVRATLKPLDIIYEKKTFKLTDYTIPGHWGHNAVYLGTKEQLIELGLWDHPALDFFREQIEQGQTVYEVRRWGLQFDNLENFLNLDEFAITRITPILDQSTEAIAEVYKLLAEQWGKDYDFTFNAMATDRTTCTEIIFLSYGEINWPRANILGRTTITPNHMGELAFHSDSPMELVGYYTATERHQLVRRTPQDFARTLGYVYRPQSSRFEEHLRQCHNRRIRRNGGIRMSMVCRDEYVHHRYTPPTPFDMLFPL